MSREKLPDLQVNQKGIVIVGFKCDEGVRRNKGRTGSKNGPESLRNSSCNHADHFQKKTIVFDGGDVICEDRDLEGVQMELQQIIFKIKSADYFPFIYGGGARSCFCSLHGFIRFLDQG